MISGRRRDELGLRQALSDRLLPVLVAAMAFLAALALTGALAAASLASHWQGGAGTLITVQVPDGDAAVASGGTRADQALAILRATTGIADANRISGAALDAQLRPWLGASAASLAIPLPAVIEVRATTPPPDTEAIAGRLREIAPGSSVERNAEWLDRLSALARSVQACAALAVLVVAGVAASVVVVATRAGIIARREAIDIVHGLGASDSYIAARFAGRALWLSGAGGAAGALAALPVLLALASLASPFGTPAPMPVQATGLVETLAASLPAPLWVALPALPLACCALGWFTGFATVRLWLGRLP